MNTTDCNGCQLPKPLNLEKCTSANINSNKKICASICKVRPNGKMNILYRCKNTVKGNELFCRCHKPKWTMISMEEHDVPNEGPNDYQKNWRFPSGETLKSTRSLALNELLYVYASEFNPKTERLACLVLYVSWSKHHYTVIERVGKDWKESNTMVLMKECEEKVQSKWTSKKKKTVFLEVVERPTTVQKPPRVKKPSKGPPGPPPKWMVLGQPRPPPGNPPSGPLRV
jgi:hypothetical protein